MLNLRYPLRPGIALVITLLVSLLGTVLVWYQYAENRRMTLEAADDLFERIARQAETGIRGMYAPAEALVNLTSRLDAVDAATPAQRLDLLGYFAEALRVAGSISSIYAGYADGSFFQVRSIEPGDAEAVAFDAPPGARFLVVSDEPGADGSQRTLRFYDGDLATLGSHGPSATDFDPRSRPWYIAGTQADGLAGSGPYRFHTPPVVGTTLARRTPSGNAVVAVDLTLATLSDRLARERVTPGSQIVAFDGDGRVVAYSGARPAARPTGPGPAPRPEPLPLAALDNPVFSALAQSLATGTRTGDLLLEAGGRSWLGSVIELHPASGKPLFLAILAPHDELLAGVTSVRSASLAISLAAVLVAIAIAWWLAHQISKSLRTLSAEAVQVRQLRLDTPIAVRSRFIEVDELATTMNAMKSAISHFVELSKGLSAEKDLDRLLERLLGEARTVCNAGGGSILLYDDQAGTLTERINIDPRTGDAVPAATTMTLSSHGTDLPLAEAATIAAGHTYVVNDIAAARGRDFSRVRQRFEQPGLRCESLLHLPLRNRQGEVIGILELLNARDRASGVTTGFSDETISFVEAFSSQAAITLDNQRLLQAQKDLLDAFIQLIAGAIDAKSPYTSGHCRRVPELVRMLAEAAQATQSGPFAEFGLNNDEWRELHIASWLHDCGKITTPEHVVDKATKLECIYDRIHEVRMRFEVLWRDAQIEQLRALAGEQADAESLRHALDARLQALRADFAFIAECNVGGEFMADDRLERLRQLGETTWLRHFDDRIGVSEEELRRKQRTPVAALPATERLLADRPEHVIERADHGHPFGDNRQGFNMRVPAHAFDLGELHNLGVRRGTLTDEDRFKINEHIVQTILMLARLPFPKELRRVPDWAGNHHEKLDGSGYPRGLTAADLSPPERMMAIADIFEALTAADRPYKKAKTLGESLRIMGRMRDERHICPDTFALFLESGVYLEYARMFLDPGQVDEVDVSQLLDRAPQGR